MINQGSLGGRHQASTEKPTGRLDCIDREGELKMITTAIHSNDYSRKGMLVTPHLYQYQEPTGGYQRIGLQ